MFKMIKKIFASLLIVILFGGVAIASNYGWVTDSYYTWQVGNLRISDDKTISVEEPTTGVFADSIYIEPDDNNVNYFKLYPSATGVDMEFKFDGSDTDVNGRFTAKGAGVIDFAPVIGFEKEIEFIGANKYISVEAPDTNTYQTLRLNTENSAVNFIQVNSKATGLHPSVQATGGDTDINLQLISKGAGYVQSVGDFQLDTDKIRGSLGDAVIEFIPQSSAVNHLQISNNSAGNDPFIQASGTDSNINIQLIPKGTGIVFSNSPIQTKHSTGFVAGNGLDENFTLLTFDGDTQNPNLSWVTADEEMRFSSSVSTAQDLIVEGVFYADAGIVESGILTVSTATDTILQSHSLVACDYTATGAVTLTLTDGLEIGTRIDISDTGANSSANTITINRSGSETFTDSTTGLTSLTITSDGSSLIIKKVSSTVWKVI